MYCSHYGASRSSQAHAHLATKRTKKQYAAMIAAVRRLTCLSVGEKYLYELILDYDYADKDSKLCKGYVYASVETLATHCGESERTIYRWLQALLKTKLIARQRRQNSASKLYVLDIPEKWLSTSQAESQNERHLPSAANPYKGNKENTKRLHLLENVKRFEAKWSEEVTHLIALGYKPEQAIADYMEFGADELREQVANLYHYMRQGKHFYSIAKWLNWAIRQRHRAEQKKTELVRSADTTTHSPSKRKQARYVEITDNTGYTYFREVEAEEGGVGADEAREAESAQVSQQEQLDPVLPEDLDGRDSMPNGTQNNTGNCTGKNKLVTLHRDATPAPLSLPLHFPDHTRTTSLLRFTCYGCGQEKSGAGVAG